MSGPADPYWRAKELFVQALDRRTTERKTFLRDTCGDDRALYEEVLSMLAAHERAVEAIPTRAVAEVVSEVPRPAVLLGDTIGPYKMLEVIGEGGMGIVYKAEQRQPIHRIVALKLIKLGMDTRQVIARFEAERQALALMNHPNVASVLDAGATPAGRPYFVMEYVPGTPITTFCDRQKYTTGQRLELFLQACDALQHAHTKAIIHRDIKPGNILVTLQDDRPVVKVIDFGIAKATAHRLTEHTVFTETGQLIGTPEYMSPEQAEMNPIDIDTRSDIYSLGVVLYELLAGALPFDGKTLREAAYAQIQAIIREVEPPRPSTRLSSMQGEAAAKIAESRGTHLANLRRELRGELEWIPLKAMRKERSRRYLTAIEFASDIHNYLAQRPLTAGPESARYRLGKFVRRNRAGVLAVTAVLTVLIAGIVGTSIGLIGQSRQRIIAERARHTADAQRVEAENQAREATRQAAIAEAVTDFQTKMFESADPDKLLGDKVTVVQVMTAAVAELNSGSLKDQPQVEAAVRMTLGNTLKLLGRYGDAEPNLVRACELCRQSPTADQRNVANALLSLGVLKHLQGNYEVAESLLREALQVYRASAPNGDKQTAQVLDRLAAVMRDRGRYAEAEPLCREALELSQRLLPADSPVVATRMNHLAMVLQSLDRIKEAEPLYRDALAIRRKAFPSGHPQTVMPLTNYAGLLAAQGRLADAEPLMWEALEIQRKTMPAAHPELASTLGNLSVILHRQGRDSEAEPLARETVAIRRKALSEGHPLIAEALNYLGLILTSQGKLEEAEQVNREALQIARNTLSAGHPKLAERLTNLAKIYIDKGTLVEAEPLLREALDIRRKAFPAGHIEVGRSLHNLAYLLERQGKLPEAEAACREALQIVRGALPPGHTDIARNQSNLASILRAQNKLPEAESLLRDAVAINKGKLTARNYEIGVSLRDLAWVLRLGGKLEEAERVARDAVGALETSLGKENGLTASARVQLALTVLEFKRYDDAEAELLAAEQVLSRWPNLRAAQPVDSRAALVELYTRWNEAEPGRGLDAKAEYWRSAPATRPSTRPTTAPTSQPTTTPTAA